MAFIISLSLESITASSYKIKINITLNVTLQLYELHNVLPIKQWFQIAVD
jgi:hypothetical protein